MVHWVDNLSSRTIAVKAKMFHSNRDSTVNNEF